VGLVASGVIDPKYAILEFVRLTFGGLVLGAFVGYLASRIIKNIDDRMIQISITTMCGLWRIHPCRKISVSQA
jgi:NhaP-type Na+/H+ or K+/H+ antiporter